jgi:hypothetical protein
MVTNKLTITKVYEGKTLVAFTQIEYEQQLNNFIHDNKFTATSYNTTQQYQKTIK